MRKLHGKIILQLLRLLNDLAMPILFRRGDTAKARATPLHTRSEIHEDSGQKIIKKKKKKKNPRPLPNINNLACLYYSQGTIT